MVERDLISAMEAIGTTMDLRPPKAEDLWEGCMHMKWDEVDAARDAVGQLLMVAELISRGDGAGLELTGEGACGLALTIERAARSVELLLDSLDRKGA